MPPEDNERTERTANRADRRPSIRLDDVQITERVSEDDYEVRIQGFNLRSEIVPPQVTVGGTPLQDVAVGSDGHQITGSLPRQPENRQVVVEYGFDRQEFTVGSGDLVITDVRTDTTGADSEGPEDETVTFENTGTLPFDLSGFVVDLEPDQPQQNVPFPDVTLQPGKRITLHVGTGADSKSDFFAGYAQEKLHDLGDAIHVRDPTGKTMLEYEYLGGDQD